MAAQGVPDSQSHDIVHIDPFRVTGYTNARSIDAANVDSVMQSIVADGKFSAQYPVAGRVSPNGDVFIINGAHRVMAMRKAIRKGHFERGYLIPMIVIAEDSSSLADITLAVRFNEQGSTSKPMKFVDYAVHIANIVRVMAAEQPTANRSRWSSVKSFALKNALQEHVNELRAVLDRNQMTLIFAVVRGLVRVEHDSPFDDGALDNRAWEMFLLCSGRRDALERSAGPAAFPDEPDIPDTKRTSSTRQSLSRAVMTCKFITDNSSSAEVFGKVLFMSVLVRAQDKESATSSSASRPTRRKGRRSSSAFTVSQTADAQLVGELVQTILHGWNALALHFGFESAEKMVAPYIMFFPAQCRYKHIAADTSRQPVYAPSSQSQSLMHNRGVLPAQSVGEACVHECTSAADVQLREMASHFLDDIYGELIESLIPKCLAGGGKAGRMFTSVQQRWTTASPEHAQFGAIPVALRKWVPRMSSLQARGAASSTPAANKRARAPAQAGVETESDDASARPQKHPRAVSEDPQPFSQSPSPHPSHGTEHALSAGVESQLESSSNISGFLPHPDRERLEEIEVDDGQGAGAQARKELAAESAAYSSAAEHTPEQEEQEEEDDDEESYGKELERSEDKAAQLWEAFQSYSSVYACSFEKLLEKHAASKSNIQLLGETQLVLVDPPYGSRRKLSLPGSSHDVMLTHEQMESVCELSVRLLRAGGHLLIFAAKEQTHKWIELLQMEALFIVDKVPLYILNSKNNMSQPPYQKTTKLKNMVSEVVHATKLGAGSTALSMVQYKCFNFVPSSYPAYANVIDNVPRRMPGETLMTKDRTQLRPEQKCVALLKELICRYSLPGDVVVDFFGGTYATGVACLSLEHPRQFVGCELDKSCNDHSAMHLLSTFASALASGRFTSVATDEARLQAQALLQRSRVAVRLSPLMPPAGMPIFPRLPEHLLKVFATSIGDITALERLAALPVADWPAADLQQFRAASPEMLLTMDALHHKVYVARSNIPSAGDGLFASQPIKCGAVVGWYNGTIVYRNIAQLRQASDGSTYGTEGLGCTVKRFKAYAMRLKIEGVEGLDDYSDTPSVLAQEPYVVPPLFCVGAKINDFRKLDTGYESEAQGAARKRNVSFQQDPEALTITTLVDPYIVKVVATRNIDAHEELLADYGSSYYTS